MVTFNGDGNVFHRSYLPGRSWSGFNNLGHPGGGISSVAIAARPTGELYVFASTDDGNIWQRTWTSSTGWKTWAKILANSFLPVTSISAAARTDGTLDLVGRGRDGAVYHRWQGRHGDVFSPWGTLGPPPEGIWGDPQVAAGPGVDVVVSSGASNIVYRKYWRPGAGWSNWVSEGAPNEFQYTFDVATTWKRNGTAFDIYAITSDSLVWRKAWGSSGGFRPWDDLSFGGDDTYRTVTVAATWRYTGQLDILYKDVETGEIYWKWWG